MPGAPHKSSPTAQLAEFVSCLEYKAIPQEVISHIKLCILDTLGCALFGSTLPWGKLVVEFVKESGQGKGAILWGDGTEVPSPNAPLANGTLVHSFEMDDLHKVGVIHPGAEVLPAADSLVRRDGSVDGKDFLTAVVAGYEVGCRVALTGGASQLRRGFHPTATSGTFAAGAAAAKILRADPTVTLHALGIAGTQAAGLMAAQMGSMVKRMHPGRAAQSGVYGALLAAKGFTGIKDILEAPYGGFCSTFVENPKMDLLTKNLGERFETRSVGFKPYPCCGSNHTSLDAFQNLQARYGRVSPQQIKKAVVRVTQATKLHVCWPYVPDSITTAQMNLPFCLAALIADGTFFVDQVMEKTIARPDILALVQRIECVEDQELETLGDQGRHGVKLEIYLNDGTCLREKVLHAKGSEAHPMSESEVEDKFHLLASKVLREPQVERLHNTIRGLEEVKDVRSLSTLLTPQA